MQIFALSIMSLPDLPHIPNGNPERTPRQSPNADQEMQLFRFSYQEKIHALDVRLSAVETKTPFYATKEELQREKIWIIIALGGMGISLVTAVISLLSRVM